MNADSEGRWRVKVAAWLHDPAEKALVLLRDPLGHEGGTGAAVARRTIRAGGPPGGALGNNLPPFAMLRAGAGRDTRVVVVELKESQDEQQARTESMRGLGLPVDVIVLPPEDVGSSRNAVRSFVGSALQEGRELYAA